MVDKQHWETAVSLTLADVPIYISLVLDSEAALPDAGAAIALASTALETLIETHLGRLAAAKCPELWSWIANRGHGPSTEEQFDVLLKIFSGKSLKDEKGLWDAFQRLQRARNKFVHTGKSRRKTSFDGRKTLFRKQTVGFLMNGLFCSPLRHQPCQRDEYELNQPELAAGSVDAPLALREPKNMYGYNSESRLVGADNRMGRRRLTSYQGESPMSQHPYVHLSY